MPFQEVDYFKSPSLMTLEGKFQTKLQNWEETLQTLKTKAGLTREDLLKTILSCDKPYKIFLGIACVFFILCIIVAVLGVSQGLAVLGILTCLILIGMTTKFLFKSFSDHRFLNQIFVTDEKQELQLIKHLIKLKETGSLWPELSKITKRINELQVNIENHTRVLITLENPYSNEQRNYPGFFSPCCTKEIDRFCNLLPTSHDKTSIVLRKIKKLNQYEKQTQEILTNLQVELAELPQQGQVPTRR